MKKYYSFFLLLVFCKQIAWSQNSIYLQPSANIFISPGTLFFADSLVLQPSVNFNITGENAISKTATVTHPTANPYIKKVFHFFNTSTPFSGDISIYYADDQLNGIAENILTLNIHNGTSWNAFTTNVIRDAVNNFVTTANLSNIALNELTLAGLSAPLPVQFTFINAACINNGVLLTWQTASEINSRDFEIQTAANGSNWQTAGTVAAAGNSSTLRNYNFTIANVTAGRQFRIVQYDNDGRFTISRIVQANCNASEFITIHPNPVHTVAVVSISLDKATPVSFRLVDAKGALVKTVQRNLLRGLNRIEFDMTGLPTGMYNLAAQWGTTLKYVSIIKQ